MKRWQKILILVILGTIFILSTYLFYNQAKGQFPSDLIAHIESALESDGLDGQYTITKPIYKFIYNYLGGNLGIAILLSITTIATIAITEKMLKYYVKEENEFKLWGYAIILNFVIAIFIPGISKNWNVGFQEPTEWHNSTYTIMKFLGIIAILAYFKIEKNYINKINFKDWIIFSILLTLINLVKPNFILSFAPAMLVFLIIDFCRNIKNKKAILNMVIFGSAVLISLSVLVYQSVVLYGEDSESGIAIGFMKVLRQYNKHPILSLFQSLAFPLFILATNFKTIIKDRKHSFIWVMNTIALGEFLFLSETGARSGDGNFDWGYSFTLMLVFISSVAILSKVKNEKTKNKIYIAFAYILLMLHLISGLIYFYRLLCGKTYG